MQYTLDRAIQIIHREKTETRRPVHEGETIANVFKEIDGAYQWRKAVKRANGSIRYYVGQTHAVQPGRGKPVLQYNPQTLEILSNPVPDDVTDLRPFVQARIRILEIWRENVLNISEADAKAEGFKNKRGFWFAWIMMYDRVGRRQIVRHESWHEDLDMSAMINRVPIVFRIAWGLRFELV